MDQSVFSRMQPEALELLRQPAPGIRVLDEISAPAWSTSTIRNRGGWPSSAQEQARSTGARLRDRPRRRSPAGIGRLSGESSRARAARQLRSSRQNSALLPAELDGLPEPTGSARGVSSSRRAAARAQTASTSCAGERLALRLGDDRRASSPRERTLELVQARAPAGGSRGQTRVYALRACSSDSIVPSGDFDLALFSMETAQRTTGPARSVYECDAAREHHRATASAWSAADLDQAHRILDDRRRVARPEQRRRQAREGRCLCIPLYQTKAPRRSQRDDPRRHPERRRARSPGTRRTGGSRSRASPRRGDRRLAPRRLGGGRRGRADAEARRHRRTRRAVRRVRLLHADPRRVRSRLVRSAARLHRDQGARGAVRRRPRPGVASQARHPRGRRRDATVHADVPHPPGGALERRRAGQRDRLRLHAPGASGVPLSGVGRPARDACPQRACRRSQDGPGRSRRALRRVAEPVRERAARARPSRPGSDAGLEERDRQPEDRQGDCERPLPRRALGPGTARSFFVAIPATGGSIRPTSIGSWCASSSRRRPLGSSFEAARSTS